MKTFEQGKTYLPNNCRPSKTGQGLTKKQFEYLKQPRGMYSIARELFNGDQWAANAFQSKFYNDGVLFFNENGTFELIEY